MNVAVPTKQKSQAALIDITFRCQEREQGFS